MEIDRKQYRSEHPVTKFCIKKIVLGQVPKYEITRSRYKNLRNAISVITLLRRLEHDFDLVLRNYQDYELVCLKIALRSGLDQQVEYQKMLDSIMQVEQGLFNLLASCRAYLDRTQQSLKLRGEKDALPQEFKRLASDEYDSSFSYRLMELLRNHGQHSGAICDSVSHAWAIEDLGFQDVNQIRRVSYVRPRVNIEILSSNRKLKRGVVVEALEAAGGKPLDITPHVRNYITCLGNIHEQIRKMVEGVFESSKKCLLDAINDYRHECGDDIVGLGCVAVSDDNIASHIFYVFKGPLERINLLRQKNNHLSKINQLIVSSDSPERMRN